jgi:2-hydroxychromene-2-carboxylate isomerase
MKWEDFMSGEVEFWFEFASTYSYVAAMRIEAAAARVGARVLWRPFLLGPIFTEQQGIKDSARAETPETKQGLRAQTTRAARLGIFGAPNFIVKGELFFGQDRLEDALEFLTGPR